MPQKNPWGKALFPGAFQTAPPLAGVLVAFEDGLQLESASGAIAPAPRIDWTNLRRVRRKPV